MHPSLLDIHSTATAQWEELPPELVHDIFHFAARLSTEFSLTLCRVSSWTRRLALPHLYSTVILKNNDANRRYRRCLEDPPFRPPEYDFEPKTALTSLWIETVSDSIEMAPDMVSIFRECDNLVHLALDAYNLIWVIFASSDEGRFLWHDIITHKKDLHLVVIKGYRQSLARQIFLDSKKITPLCSKITHFQWAHASDYQAEFFIPHFTRLTHLCVPFWLPTHDLSVLDHILNHLSVEALVVTVYMDLVKDDDLLRVRTWFQEKCSTDRRIYLIDSRSDAIQQEWEQEVRGGESIWSRALRSTGTLQKGE